MLAICFLKKYTNNEPKQFMPIENIITIFAYNFAVLVQDAPIELPTRVDVAKDSPYAS